MRFLLDTNICIYIIKQKPPKVFEKFQTLNPKVSKIQRKVANQRQDWTHKVAAQIVSGNSLVATEELNLKGMTAKAKKGSKRKAHAYWTEPVDA